MRFVVVGAGAVGGVIAGRMHQAGHELVAVARGDHGRVMARDGLRLESGGGTDVIRLPVVTSTGQVDWRGGDVVLLAVKSQHTVGALDELRAETGLELPIVCVQNGVGNEDEALRRYRDVYGVCVMCPCGFTEPGVVEARSFPVSGLLDIGRYPTGVDQVARAVSAAWSSSTFDSRVIDDVMRWKYRKLILNLGNAVEVVCGPGGHTAELAARLRAEAEACLSAAGIDVASSDQDHERRADLLTRHPASGCGGSSWQSVQRSAGSVETDHLTGEIVRLGRLHNVGVAANELVQRLAVEVAVGRRAPGSISPDEVIERVDREPGG